MTRLKESLEHNRRASQSVVEFNSNMLYKSFKKFRTRADIEASFKASKELFSF